MHEEKSRTATDEAGRISTSWPIEPAFENKVVWMNWYTIWGNKNCSSWFDDSVSRSFMINTFTFNYSQPNFLKQYK